MNQKIAVSVVFVAAMFMNIMDITIVNVALPTMGRDLHVAATAVSAVSIGYLVSLAVVIPASGWLGDRLGPKRVLLAAIVIFTVASGLCGIAQNFTELVLFRVLQGVGGGMLTPVGMAMLFRVFPPSERVRASSILTVPVAVAPALGPVLGGVLVTSLSWRWVFFVNLPIGAAAFAFGVLFLRDQDSEVSDRFDLPGFVLSGIGFASLMYGVSEGPQGGWSSIHVLATLAVGVILLGVLVVHQTRKRLPLLRLRLFSDGLFRNTNIVMFLGGAGFLGVLYVVALFFQDGLGMSALASGLSTFPEALGVMVGAQFASRLFYPTFGPRRTMSVGLLGVAVSIGLMALIDSRAELWWMRALMLMLGFCMGHVFVPAQAASFARITPADTGHASTLFNSIRQLGGAVGVAVLTTSLTIVGVTRQVGGHPVSDLHAYHVTFIVAAVLALAGVIGSLAINDADAEETRNRRGGDVPDAELAAAG
ncbi:MAG TPA: MDR family MFS transporter [Mycobacteriales bacterium]|jgi:EmrB/QacA subfamily drug resistance transporter|nr:MDR family MFS transporter [Mycobacteriales bacterium]